MKFEKHYPTPVLSPYIKYYIISEQTQENEYTVFPSTGLVIGFQYRGQLSLIQEGIEKKLSSAGITGMSEGYKIFKNSMNIGTLLVYFTEIGFTHFGTHAAHELYNLSLSLDEVFDKNLILEIEEKLSEATTDVQRIKIIDRFLLQQLKDIKTDQLILEAVKIIYESKGNIRIQELHEKLFISKSPFEKRFRKVVGTTAKKFASIVRFQSVLEQMQDSKSLAAICYENQFFDQSHFIKNFKQFTGETPDNFKQNN